MSYLDEIEDKEVLEIVRRIRRKAGLEDILPLPNKASPNNNTIAFQHQRLDHVMSSAEEKEVDMDHDYDHNKLFSSQSYTSRTQQQRENSIPPTQRSPSIMNELFEMEKYNIYEYEYNESLQSIVDIEGSLSHSYNRKFHGLSTVDTFYIPEEEDRYATLSALSENSSFVPFETQRPKMTRRPSPRTPTLKFSLFCMPNTTCSNGSRLYYQVSNDDESCDEYSILDDASGISSEYMSTSTGTSSIILDTVPSCFSNMGEIVQKLASWDSKDRGGNGSSGSRRGQVKKQQEIKHVTSQIRSSMDIVQMARSDSLRSSITSASCRTANSSLASHESILYEA